MAVKILSLEMPETRYDWGIIQINNFSNTYYRFEMIAGKPKLDTTYFADQLVKPEEKHRNISPESNLYKEIQQALNDYIKE
ncbi:hypothetical protein [Virgibacillus siamensis]|uniref:hypothetical protein n=1 Tax=Virgibacillus siamensis TaxID=480071 RepID=UPI0009848BDD|nr:hypothetical protein [Virgibacillus siamensis]